MKRLASIVAAALLFAATPAVAAERYSIDKSHTNIVFFVNHLGYSDMVGTFTDYDGEIRLNETDPAKSSVSFTIRPAGVRTSSEELDEHLQGEKFFNSAKFPEVKFVSTAVAKTGANTADVTGNLTLLGVTKPIVLKVKLNKAAVHPMTGKYVTGFSATATVKRSEFGMKEYVPMVGDDVRFIIETEAVNEDRAAAPAKKG